MAKTTDEIATAVMGGLYHFIDRASGADIDRNENHDPFICWFKPGIPFGPDDFRFSKWRLLE